MKRLKQNLLIVLLSLSFAAVAALPPDMQADRYLVQVEKALKGKDKDYKTAAEAMDKIMALKDKHNLEMPIEFYFKYAKVLIESRTKADEAFAAINHYLTATGKSGANYAEALGLYDRAIFWQLVYVKTITEANKLLELGADVNSTEGKYKETPLHKSAYLSTPETIRILIALDADISAKSTDGLTPLMAAINRERDTLANIKTLIAAGADVNAVDAQNGWTVIYYLQEKSYMNKDDKATAERWLKNPSLLR